MRSDNWFGRYFSTHGKPSVTGADVILFLKQKIEKYMFKNAKYRTLMIVKNRISEDIVSRKKKWIIALLRK